MLVGAAGTNIRHDEFYGYTGNDIIDNSDGGLSLVLAGDGNDIVTGGDEMTVSMVRVVMILFYQAQVMIKSLVVTEMTL